MPLPGPPMNPQQRPGMPGMQPGTPQPNVRALLKTRRPKARAKGRKGSRGGHRLGGSSR